MNLDDDEAVQMGHFNQSHPLRVFDISVLSNLNSLALPDIPQKIISAEMKEIISIILESSMMLEEDAEELYMLSSKLHVNRDYLFVKSLLCGGAFIICGCLTLLLKEKNKIVVVPCWIASTIPTIINLRKLISYNGLKQSVKHLCSQITEAFIGIRRRIKFLEQYTARIISKTAKANLKKFSTTFVDNEFELSRRPMSRMSVDLLLFILQLIREVKTTALYMLEIFPQQLSDPHLLLGKTDYQLGLDSILKEYNEGQLKYSSIEVCRHINILLQSEFLRILGTTITKITVRSEMDKLTRILNTYSNTLTNLSSQNIKNLEFDNSEQSKNIKHVSRNKERSWEYVVGNVSKTLRSYLHSINADLLDIEKALNKLSDNSLTPDEAKCDVGKSLDFIEGEIEEIMAFVGSVRKILISGACSSPETPVINVLPQKVTCTGIEVGTSDFSISLPDEVFFSVPDKDDTEVTSRYENCMEEAENNSKLHSVYDSVLTELKISINPKKEEFEQRELKVLQKNPNYQAYMDYQDRDTKNITDLEVTERVSNEELNLQREISLQAINKSCQWKVLSEETNFES